MYLADEYMHRRFRRHSLLFRPLLVVLDTVSISFAMGRSLLQVVCLSLLILVTFADVEYEAHGHDHHHHHAHDGRECLARSHPFTAIRFF